MRLEAEPPHEVADDLAVALAVHAGQAQANGRRRLRLGAERLIDDRVQHLLDLEFAVHLEVGAPAPAFPDDPALAVGQQGHGLAPAGVDSQYAASA